ncbi:MAG: hypothetical protein JNL39_17130 [Opitutaceae bacterium]|nr:hypothetical protein [Opitutaceae bacterium]
MFLKRVNDVISVSTDGESESFKFGADEMADISYVCAWPGDSSLLVTAARSDGDRADVMAGKRGNYRAYLVSAQGIEQLTKEYTNTAISLPDRRGLAFSNGSALVVVRDGQRQAHKIGRFNWGPTSLSCSESGSRIAMTKWKGDNRHLAFTEVGSATLTVSRFSFHSYVLIGDEILYIRGSDVMCYSPLSGKGRSITPQMIRRKLLDAIGVGGDRLEHVVISFGNLSLRKERAVATTLVQLAGTYEWLWHGIIQLPYQHHPLEIVLPIERPWAVSSIASTGDTLGLVLQRYENLRLAETKVAAIGRAEKSIMAGWWPASHPRLPSLGFQFMP